MGVRMIQLTDAAAGTDGWTLILAGVVVLVIGLLMLRYRRRVVRTVVNSRSSWLSETRLAQRIDSWLPIYAFVLSCIAVGYGVVVIAIGIIRIAGIEAT
ncbi:hypothetical protein ACX3O0_01670 [Homoserinimonas sp. A447]